MKKGKMTVFKRAIVGALALILAISTPCASLQAATVDPQFYSSVYKDVKAAYGTNASKLQTHYDVFGEKEGRSANLQDAVEKKDSRSLIIYYLAKNASYYRKNGLNLDFPFFNADNYLKANPDVAKAVKNNKMGALEHYLTYGAMEGRGSGTAFDPIIAIAARPTLGNLAPTQLLAAWTKAEGNATTSEYTLRINFNQNIPIKYTATKKTAPVAVSEESNSSGDSGSSSSSPVIENKASFTLMVYLCGTDLESKAGQREATRTLIKIILGAYDEENVDVAILAGGTNHWKNTYLNDLLGTPVEERISGYVNKSAIFTVNKDGVKAAIDGLLERDDIDVDNVDDLLLLVLDEDSWTDYDSLANYLINDTTLTMNGSVSEAPMGSKETLESLLNYAKTFDSDKYGLSLWNHGGGSLEGVCFPECNKADGLTIKEIRDALKNTDFGSTASDSEYKLSLLAFDACLMGGAEAAAYLNNFYDMMYGSEETTYGDIDYYNIINTANQKASDDYLGYWLAIGIIEDRLINYTGTEKMLATGALFENGALNDSLNAINDLAAVLNEILDPKTAVEYDKTKVAPIIYNAIKNARLKCEQIGSGDSNGACRDYVDMTNFLDMLDAELKNALVEVSPGTHHKLYDVIGYDNKVLLTKALADAIVAADDATYATVFNYGDHKIYYHLKDSTEAWYNEEFWKQLKGMRLNGANIYVPYFGVKNNTISTDLEAYSEYVQNLGLDSYNELISAYSEYLKTDDERVKQLALDLVAGTSQGTEIVGYEDLLSMYRRNVGGSEVLTVKIKDYASNAIISGSSSGDAFIDLFETMDTMIVYITRKAQALSAEASGSEPETMPVDIVIGSKTISYENLNGLQETVNIFTEPLKKVDVNVVSGTVVKADDTTPQSDYDFVLPDNISDEDKSKMIAAVDAEGVLGNYITVYGTLTVSGGTSTAYHLFSLNGSKYDYMGSVQYDEENAKWSKTENVTSISFYHQTITTAHGMDYAESCAGISALYGAKEYSTENLSIQSIALGNTGDMEENDYYFGFYYENEEGLEATYIGPKAEEYAEPENGGDSEGDGPTPEGEGDGEGGDENGDGEEGGEGGSDSGEGGEEGTGSTD